MNTKNVQIDKRKKQTKKKNTNKVSTTCVQVLQCIIYSLDHYPEYPLKQEKECISVLLISRHTMLR